MILKNLLLIIAGFVFGFNAYSKESVFNFKPNKKCCYALIPFALLILSFCVTYVPANNVGVRYSAISGTSNKTLNEGITFKLPIDKIYCIPTTVEERTIKKMNVQTKDAQFVTSEVNVKFQVNKKDAFKVYKRYTTLDSLKQNIISNYAQKSIESVVTKYNVIDVLGAKKNEVYALSTKDLEEKLESEGIKLVSLTIKNMNAGEEIEQAIADEAVAKKRVETAEQNRLKAKKDAETKLINAQAESDANKILEKQLTNKILKQQLIAKWDGKLPAVTSGNENILDIDNLIE